MRIRYPDAPDAFNLGRNRAEKNIGTIVNLLEPEDVWFILQELEAMLGSSKYDAPGSVEWRVRFLESLNPKFQSLDLIATPVFGGLIVSGLTKGSVIFAGDGGVLLGSPGTLFVDFENGRLGILQAAPAYTLDVVGTARLNGILRVGSGTIGAAQLQVLQPTAGNEVQRLESASGTTNPARSIYQPKLTTSNAAVTTMLSLALASETMVTIEATINGFRQNGSDGGAFIMRGSFSNRSGTITQLGTTDSGYVKKITATNWVTSFSISGTNVLVQIAGDTGHNVMWTGHIVVTSGSNG